MSVAQNISNFFRKLSTPMVINGRETERFVHFTEAVKWVMQTKQCSNQEATHFVWDNQFKIGTDRAIWLTV